MPSVYNSDRLWTTPVGNALSPNVEFYIKGIQNLEIVYFYNRGSGIRKESKKRVNHQLVAIKLIFVVDQNSHNLLFSVNE